MTQYTHIALADLAPSPTNPRKHFDEDSLRELAATIADHGVIEPIIVRAWPDDYPVPEGHIERPQYEIVAGERRYRASLMVQAADIPALVRELTDRQVAEIQIIENLQRRGVNELEEADGYRLMMQDFGYTADELAAKIGKSRAYIYGRLKLCDLGEYAREAFLAGDISASVALLVARIPTAELQARAVADITQVDMSARAAAQHIQSRYMLDLSRAPFPTDDPLLYNGACTACPHNTSTDRELFADVRANVCTNPDCMVIKKQRYIDQIANELREAGHTVILGDEARSIAPYGKQGWILGYSLLDAMEWDPVAGHDSPRREQWAEFLDGHARVFIEDVQIGGFMECLPEVEACDMRAARRAQNSDLQRAGDDLHNQLDARQAQANAEAEARRERLQTEQDRRTHLAKTLRERMATSINGAAALNAYAGELRLVARTLLDEGFHGDIVLERWFPDCVVGDETDPDVALAGIERFDGAKLLALILDFIMEGDLTVQPWRLEDTPETLHTLAGIYGVPTDLAAEPPESAPDPSEAAQAQDPEPAETPEPPPAETKAAPARASKPAKPKTKPAPAKAAAKSNKSSGRASPAGGKGKTTTSPAAKAKKSAEVVA